MKWRNKPKVRIISRWRPDIGLLPNQTLGDRGKKKYSWQLRAGNGKVMLWGQWYKRRWQAVRAVSIVQWLFLKFPETEIISKRRDV